jgi:hypothetical protein
MQRPVLIPNATARRLFLARQALSRPPRQRLGRDGLLELIEALGFVQVDSISTVARAHHMILFARNQTYRPAQLDRLLERDRSLFEHWTHDAAVIPTAYYRYWHHRFDRERRDLVERWRKWRREDFEHALESVLETVRAGGPTMARDLGQGNKKPAGGWWDWHPEKTALEYHWRTGALAIARRRGFQKVYDLSERVIPDDHRADWAGRSEFVDWSCRSALARLGAATAGEIAAFWDLVAPRQAGDWCRRRLAGGDLIEVLVEPADGARPRKAFAFPDLPAQLRDLPTPPARIRVLSPFDPLIRDRARCRLLFGFDYRIEVFVPAAKREYGYYVFPLLEDDRLFARIDMKHDKGMLRVTGLWLEPGVKLGKGRRAALDAELDRQRRFVGAEKVVFADRYMRT